MKNEMEYLLKVRIIKGADLTGKELFIESNAEMLPGTTHTFGDYTFLVLSTKDNPLPKE
jgi:hypothetical protein